MMTRLSLCSCWTIIVCCLAVLMRQLHVADGYPFGAPLNACPTMEPNHGSLPDDGPCPYVTVLDRTEMLSNETLIVTLQNLTTESVPFQGFLVMAKDETNLNGTLGSFDQPNSTLVQLLDCLGLRGSAVTHTSTQGKTSVELTWRPPLNFEGNVTIYTTFAQSQNPYWVRQPSRESVRITRAVTESSTTPSGLSTEKPPELPNPYAGCTDSKGCFGFPSAECIETKSCSMMATYRPLTNESFEFEIYGKLGPTSINNGYVALGFSSNPYMGDDSVIQCVYRFGELAAYNSYNLGYSGNIRSPVEGFNLTSASYSEGYVYCKVQQPTVYSVNNLDFNLNQSYHLLLAVGPVGGSDHIDRHDAKVASSNPIDLKDPSAETTSSTIPSSNSSTEKPPAPFPTLYDGCMGVKGCFGFPSAECIGTKSCAMMATYRSLTNESFEFEIYGKLEPDSSFNNGYVALGFSSDPKMGDDSVIQCVYRYGALDAYHSYNLGASGNIRSPIAGMNMTAAAYSSGYVYCKVQLPAVYSVNNLDFNLNQLYHLLLAAGPVGGSDHIDRHEKKTASNDPINLAKPTVSGGGEYRVLVQLHGCFMVISWMIAASIGVLMPRYMKKSFRGRKLLDKDLWFIVHQVCMYTAWVFTITAFIIIFVHVGGWTKETKIAHPVIGCIVMGLTFIQPIMAFFRPLPKSPNRWKFNWAHSLVGYSAHILAVTCIFLAVDLNAAKLPDYTYWVLTAHIVCYCGTQVALTVLEMKKGEERGVKIRWIIVGIFAAEAIGLGIAVLVFIATS